jgi:hypothetical protein
MNPQGNTYITPSQVVSSAETTPESQPFDAFNPTKPGYSVPISQKPVLTAQLTPKGDQNVVVQKVTVTGNVQHFTVEGATVNHPDDFKPLGVTPVNGVVYLGNEPFSSLQLTPDSTDDVNAVDFVFHVSIVACFNPVGE